MGRGRELAGSGRKGSTVAFIPLVCSDSHIDFIPFKHLFAGVNVAVDTRERRRSQTIDGRSLRVSEESVKMGMQRKMARRWGRVSRGQSQNRKVEGARSEERRMF